MRAGTTPEQFGHMLLHVAPAPGCDGNPEVSVVSIAIESIRRDGGTQGRMSLDARTVEDYAALMAEGIRFPPIKVWFDGTHYWLSDGFQRVAAAERIDLKELPAEIVLGSLADAQWDSYSANGKHGLRRTRADIEKVIRGALSHPYSQALSTNHLARDLNIPEATLRRWRGRLTSLPDEDGRRMAHRRGKEYVIRTALIGKSAGPLRTTKPKRELRRELLTMKRESSPDVRRVLNVLGNWMFGPSEASACLRAIESLIREWRGLT